MNQHRVDPHRLEEDDIAQESLHDMLIVHRGSAVFDHEEMAAESLDKGKRLDEEFDAIG